MPQDEYIVSSSKIFFENTDQYVFIKDFDLKYVAASRSFARLTLLKTPERVIGKKDRDLFADPKIADIYAEDDRLVLSSGNPIVNKLERLPSEDGMERWCSTSKYAIRDKSGDVIGIFGIAHDITSLHTSVTYYNNEIEYLTALNNGVLSATVFNVTMWRKVSTVTAPGEDPPLPCICASPERRAAVAGACKAPETLRFIRKVSRAFIERLYFEGRRSFSFEYRLDPPHGNGRWVREEYTALFNPSTAHIIIVAVMRDIELLIRERSRLLFAAKHDSMTGLLNHTSTHNEIGSFLSGAGAKGSHAVFYIDIDNFKHLNDTLGHLHGDQVICRVSAALKNVFRRNDIVGRVGGDEFLGLMKNLPDIDTVKSCAMRLLDALTISYNADGKPTEITCSIGAAFYSGDGQDYSSLLHNADMALYSAKRMGKNNFVLSDK